MLNTAMLPPDEFNACTKKLFTSKTQLAVRLRCGQIVDDVELACAPSRDCDDAFYSESEAIYWSLNGSHYRRRSLDIVAVGKYAKLVLEDTRRFVCADEDTDIEFEYERYDHYDIHNRNLITSN